MSLAEALGRLILQDPSFTIVFNDIEEQKDSDERVLTEPNFDMRQRLKQKEPGLWAHSSKYSELVVYFCYVSPRPKAMHNSLFSDKKRFHNVLVVSNEDLPYRLKSHIVIPKKWK